MKRGFRVFAMSEYQEKKVFFFLVFAIAFSIPFVPIYNSICSIALLVFWLFLMEKEFTLSKVKVVIEISILFWIALLGIIYTQNGEEALFRLQQKSLLLILPLVFGTAKLNWLKNIEWIITIFIAALVIACLICLAGAFMHWLKFNDPFWFFSQDLAEVIHIYPYVLGLLCLSAIIILVEASQGRLRLHASIHHRIIFIALISFLSVFLFLLSVVQILLIWSFFVVAYSIKINSPRRVLTILLIGICSVALASYSIPSLRSKVKDIFVGEGNTIPLDKDASLGRTWNGIAMRKAVWTCSLDVIKQNFWIGVGTGDAQDELQAAYEKRQFYFASRYNRYNAHNQYLQVLVSHGFIGLIIWLTCLFWLWRNNKSNILFSSLLVSLLFAMLTESMLETNKGTLSMAFLLTVFYFGKQGSTKNL